MQEIPLATFHVNRSGASAESDFRIADETTQSFLGFAIRGVAPTTEDSAHVMNIIQTLAGGSLRLKLQLFEQTNSNCFYEVEFPVAHAGHTENLIYSGNTNRPHLLFFVTGVTPLPYGNYDLHGDASVSFRVQANAEPLRNGKLRPGVDYRLKLTVLVPASVTNTCQLWLLSMRQPMRPSR